MTGGEGQAGGQEGRAVGQEGQEVEIEGKFKGFLPVMWIRIRIQRYRIKGKT